MTQGDAVQALLLRLVPLQVRVQHEARLGVGVLKQQPVCLRLQGVRDNSVINEAGVERNMFYPGG